MKTLAQFLGTERRFIIVCYLTSDEVWGGEKGGLAGVITF